MVFLDNYSRENTYINITSEGYSIVDSQSVNEIECGEGGFTEEGELLGIYVRDEKLFFQYNNKSYETKPDEIKCTNEILCDGRRSFKVEIKEALICNIVYKPYISPFVLTYGDEEDEFDFLVHLSNLLANENAILKFMKGMDNLRKYF